MKEFTHIDEKGKAKMVDVTDKDETKREAIAYGQIKLKESTLERVKNGQIEKGAVLETARVAGIMGVKKTAELIPMCHPLLITGIDIKFEFENATTLGIYATVRTRGKTGVEMEAFTGVSIAALTVYDMCKAVDKDMVIKNIKLMKKTGGKSGTYVRENDE
ncbi:cyclic pyranopterin monophosphate synthase MoaC [Petrotoga olearia]|uniref:Cyclic pyranopterin monophosphate synthase n=2 Tax=Petrotoga olearia TaxID=156203 RepID=A0A2K1P598_9BACT|nr:cyclic pyranopterin monophosphate synthase MoaC [Petrotoga olearia]PNR97975.1 molybdenum cofactor biosynthesis protein C [Petrotoga olearia DSM 13574]RMA75551.1 cyclic pyranopterin monophosphate synthase subunit MoaC [Petrotoga olearia]